MNTKLKGIILSLGANVCFTTMAILIGYLKDISSFTSAFIRFGVGLLVIILGIVTGIWKFQLIHKRLLCLRGIIGGIVITLFFLTLTKIGIGRATLISHLYPAFAAIFALYFIKEKLTIQKLFSFGLAFGGIYVLSKAKGITNESFLVWDILALTGAILAGVAVVIIKKLHETDSTIAILFAQCVGGSIITCIPGILGAYTLGSYEIIILISIGIAATTGQLMMTQGYKYLSAATGSLLHMTIPLFNMIAGVILFSEPFGWHEIMAFILISGSCIVLVARRRYSEILEE